MESIKMHADFENHFKDVTLEPFVYEYNEEEEIEGHKFVHVKDGVFKAEPAFSVSQKEIKRLSRTYRDVEFYGFEINDMFEVRFAISEVGTTLDTWSWYTAAEVVDNLDEWKWWEESKENKISTLRNGRQRELSRIKFERGEFYVYDDEEDAAPLPEKKNAFNFIYNRVVREDGTVPRIMLNGYIGDMVEPGIYYFNHQKGRHRPMVTTGTSFGKQDVAAVANFDYGITTTIFLHYLALDRKYFARLKEIADNLDYCFFHEFIKSEPEGEKERNTAVTLEELLGTEEEQEEREKEKERKRQALCQQLGGEELMKGLGTENLELCFEIPLVEKRGFKDYEYVAKKDNVLILVYEGYVSKACRDKEFNVEQFDMRLMTHLEVKQRVMLNCGYEYDTIHKIIDCTKEKYKEILTPEAYALYQEQWKEQGE